MGDSPIAQIVPLRILRYMMPISKSSGDEYRAANMGDVPCVTPIVNFLGFETRQGSRL
jgi:hypothetical protein